jgi:CRISPR-associated protein Csx14
LSDPRPQICIATLGGQPQVVTLAIDELLGRGYPISELFVIHLSTHQPRYANALALLEAEFVGGVYGGRRCRLQRRPVRVGAEVLGDLQSDQAIRAASDMLHQLIHELKQEDATLHLCISGGRRLLGTLLFSAALLYLDQSDHVWHLYSSDAVRAATHEGRQLHLPGHPEVALAEVAFTPWGRFFPILRERPGRGAGAAYAASTHQADEEELQRCRAVYELLSPRLREVLRAIAQDHEPQLLAAHLKISQRTLDDYKSAIFAECRVGWALPADVRPTFDWVRRKFAPYLHLL